MSSSLLEEICASFGPSLSANFSMSKRLLLGSDTSWMAKLFFYSDDWRLTDSSLSNCFLFLLTFFLANVYVLWIFTVNWFLKSLKTLSELSVLFTLEVYLKNWESWPCSVVWGILREVRAAVPFRQRFFSYLDTRVGLLSGEPLKSLSAPGPTVDF